MGKRKMSHSVNIVGDEVYLPGWRLDRSTGRKGLKDQYPLEASWDAILDRPKRILLRQIADLKSRAVAVIEAEAATVRKKGLPATAYVSSGTPQFLWSQSMKHGRATGASYAQQILSLIEDLRLIMRRPNGGLRPDLAAWRLLFKTSPDATADLVSLGMLLGRQYIRMEVALQKRGGRPDPETLTPEQLKEAEKLKRQGLSNGQIARKFRVKPSTVRYRLTQKPRLSSKKARKE